MQDGSFEEMEILELKNYSILEYTWGEDSVRFEFQPTPEGCSLFLIERIKTITSHTPKDLAGWHVCLEVISTLMDGRTMDSREKEWEKLYKKYVEVIQNMEEKHMANKNITIETIIKKPIDQVWAKWTLPKHIMEWNNASEDWYTPSAENDLRVGGAFNYRMAARDGSFSFDFSGIYDEVIVGRKIAYTLGDNRKVVTEFAEEDGCVKIVETFEAEETHSLEMQKSGWQAILDNFKRYAETL